MPVGAGLAPEVNEMTQLARKAVALLCVALMAVTSFAAMASAGDVEGEVGGMLDGTKPGEDQALADEVSASALKWQRGIEIVDANSDGNPERVTAAEVATTACGASWMRVFEVRDADSDGVVDHVVGYEIAKSGDKAYTAALKYVDADSDGNPETFEAYQAYRESDVRWAVRWVSYVDADSDGNPEVVTVHAQGQWDALSWVATARLVDATSDGNPEGFEAYQAVATTGGDWARRYVRYVDADSDGNPEGVGLYEDAQIGAASYMAAAGMEDFNSDGNPEKVEAFRIIVVGQVAVAAEHLKIVDADSDGNPESVSYGALAALADGSVAVKALEIKDADSDGNPESVKAYEALRLAGVAIGERGVECTDADSDGHPEKVTVAAWAVTTEGKAVEAAEWIDANSDGNPESIKAYREVQTTSGVHVVQAFEYTDADSDGNPEKVTAYEVGEVVWKDEGVEAMATSGGEALPPMEDLSQVKAPAPQDIGVGQQLEGMPGVAAMHRPWGDSNLKPWQQDGKIVG